MSIFRGIDRSAIVRDPFPHVVLRDAIDPALFRRLVAEFPPHDSFTNGASLPDNTKVARLAPGLLADPALSPSWRRWINDNLTQAALRDAVGLFADDIRREFPDFEARFGALDSLRAGRRGSEGAEACDARLDTVLGVLTPVTGQPCVERGPHLKVPNKIIEAFLFLRRPDDNSPGGELDLFAVRPGATPRCHGRFETDRANLDVVRSIPAAANTAVLWVNTPRSFQQIALRGPSPFAFWFHETVVEMPRTIFEVTWERPHGTATTEDSAAPRPSLVSRLVAAIRRR